MKYDVHVYTVVRVKLKGIEADSHEAAMKKADEACIHELFDGFKENFTIKTGSTLEPGEPLTVAHVESAEEISGYCVDEVDGKGELLRYQHYNADYNKS